MPYASLSDVQARDPYRAISASTKPSDAQVTAWITETEAMLNGTLAAAQIMPSGGDYANILKAWVVDRVSGLVRVAYAIAGGDSANKDGEDLVKAFAELLKDIRNNASTYGPMLTGGAASDSTRKMRGYVLDNDDGLSIGNGDFAPEFTKAASGDQF